MSFDPPLWFLGVITVAMAWRITLTVVIASALFVGCVRTYFSASIFAFFVSLLPIFYLITAEGVMSSPLSEQGIIVILAWLIILFLCQLACSSVYFVRYLLRPRDETIKS